MGRAVRIAAKERNKEILARMPRWPARDAAAFFGRTERTIYRWRAELRQERNAQ
jgi:hypothetical protein